MTVERSFDRPDKGRKIDILMKIQAGVGEVVLSHTEPAVRPQPEAGRSPSPTCPVWSMDEVALLGERMTETHVRFGVPSIPRKWSSLNSARRNDGAGPYMVAEGTLEACIREFMAKPEAARHLYEIHTAPQPPLITEVLSAAHVIELARLRIFSEPARGDGGGSQFSSARRRPPPSPASRATTGGPPRAS
jgi:hypothetical protein